MARISTGEVICNILPSRGLVAGAMYVMGSRDTLDALSAHYCVFPPRQLDSQYLIKFKKINSK